MSRETQNGTVLFVLEMSQQSPYENSNHFIIFNCAIDYNKPL